MASKLPRTLETYRIDNKPLEPFSEPTHHEDHPQYTASDDPMPYDDSYHVGHVATDDKTLFARMAHMASAPPRNTDEGGSSALVISAPDWQDEDEDEELERVIDNTRAHGRPLSAPLDPLSTSFHLFPPPTAKDKMAAPNFYEYPYSFEEDEGTLEPEPSAPPFEQHGPSAPPLGDAEMVPSAPPLPEPPSPSAPDWDWGGGERSGLAFDPEEEIPQRHPSCPTPTPVPVTGHLPSYRA